MVQLACIDKRQHHLASNGQAGAAKASDGCDQPQQAWDHMTAGRQGEDSDACQHWEACLIAAVVIQNIAW